MSDLDEETQQQKRIRLTKTTLQRLKSQVQQEAGFDAKDLDDEIIQRRIQEFVAPVVYQYLQDTKVIGEDVFKLHEIPTAICYAQDYLFVSTKDCSIIQYHIPTRAKKVVKGEMKQTKRWVEKVGKQELVSHSDTILTMDVSHDLKYLVTGGMDKKIMVWDAKELTKIHEFTQHRDAISSLKFRLGSYDLYSASYDRTIKVWNIGELTYVETLFGHQDYVTCLHALQKELVLSVGSRDRTCRLWKIVEESQLVFRGGGGKISEELVVMQDWSHTEKKRVKDDGLSGGSMDVCCMLEDGVFVSGTDGGSVSLWSTTKKKPIFTKLRAHGVGSPVLGEEDKRTAVEEAECSWITALGALSYSDLFASGSGDGFIRIWKLSEEKRSFTLQQTIPVDGIVNHITFFVRDKQVYLSAAIGREPRMGRWFKTKCKNRITIFCLGALAK